MNKMIYVIFLVILGVGTVYLISRYNKSTENSRYESPDENLKDQLVLVPKLARLLAKDRAFVCEIGLDEFLPHEIVEKLELVIGFIFAMHNTAKSIFESDEYPTLDDKFIELIYSRIRLMPEILQSKPRPRDYAKQCYREVKRKLDESGDKWETMTLYEQFFEICVRVFLEEMKLDRPDLHLLMPEFEEVTSRSIMASTFKAVFSYVNWELGQRDENHGASKDQQVKESVILEHPFWDDYLEAFRSAAVGEVDPDSVEKIRRLTCGLFPAPYLKMRWEGWQLGIRRPPESFPKEWLDLREKDIELFLRDFFRRVEHGELYCDYSLVVKKFGEELVGQRMRGKSGLHYNLERVYWTLNVKLNDWIDQNIKTYDCSLVCELDEIVARTDSWLGEAFFPTPGPLDIGSRKRKELQKQMLHEFAPALEKPLIEQIWRD